MKSISLLASLAAVSAICVSISCSSSDKKDTGGGGAGGEDATAGKHSGGSSGSKDNAGTDNGGSDTAGTGSGEAGAGNGEAGTGSGEAGAGGGDSSFPAATPIVCPEPNPFGKLKANSVAVSGATLTKDDHWTADKTYLVFDNFGLDNHVLTVDAGTVICLSNQAQILVGQGGDFPGEIHLNGTAANPVTITSFAATDDPTKPGDAHLGLKLDTYGASTLSYVNIWYGGDSVYAFELTDTARDDNKLVDPTKPLLIDHLTIGEVQSKGLRIGPEVGVDPASSIRFTEFAAPTGSAHAPDVLAEVNIFGEQSLAAVLEYDKAKIPAAAQRFRILTAAPPLIIDKDVTLTDPGVPLWYDEGTTLHVSGQEEDAIATLTIDAGVTLKMRAEMLIGDTHEGNLIIAGTAAKPVVITSIADVPAAGDWEGIFFESDHFDPAKSKISHAQILYAGTNDLMASTHHVEQCGTDLLGAIQIGGTEPTGYAGPAISDTLIAHSTSNGIASSSGDNGVHLTTDYSGAALKLTFQDIADKNIVTDACQ